MSSISRRAFLTSAAAAAAIAGLPAAAKSSTLPKLKTIIDTHVHFYDPSRPGGVPWPPPNDAILNRRILPDVFRKLTAPLGIKSVIEVEASPLVEDNQWILDLAAQNPIILGTSGHLEPGKPGFGQNLDHFRQNPRFLGIRVSNASWGQNLHSDLQKPEFISDLKLLSQAGLEVDSACGVNGLPDVLRLTDLVPDLRVVIDHMPFDPPLDQTALRIYKDTLREIGKRPQVFCKVSTVLRRVENRPVEDVNYYRPMLDELWDVFGPDRLIYGSNWPVSDKVGPYDLVFKVVREYFGSKGRDASEKYFWKNSKAAYRWKA